MSYLDFEEFFIKMYDNDYIYLNLKDYYGFRVVFYEESFYWQKKIIYPIYPWNNFINKNIFNKHLKKKNVLLNNEIIIEKLKSENIELKKKIAKKNTQAKYQKFFIFRKRKNMRKNQHD